MKATTRGGRFWRRRRGGARDHAVSGPVSLAGGCGHDPPGWSPAATGHAVGHRVVATPLPLPAPPARHARHAFVKQVLKARCSEAAPRRPRSSGYEIAREVPGEVGSARSLGADDVRVPEV